MIPIKTRHMILLFLGALAIAMAIFWYNYSALGYSLSDLTTFFLAKDSRVQERLIMQPGTSTGVSIVAGTQTDTWLSNPDDLTLPRIELNGTTGVWGFKNRGTGTETESLVGTDHTHNGSDSSRVAHGDLTGTGTNNHADIDTFIASKAQANGLASTDANNKTVQDPASGTSTPGLNKVVMSDGAGKISDDWLSNNITKLGTPTTDNISEGSTNKYYTDARVNAAVGSTSVSAHNDVTIVSPGSNQVLMYNSGTGQWENNTSTASIAWGGITGNPNDQVDTQMSQAEAEGGTNTASKMPSAERMAQAIQHQNGTTTPQVLKIKIGTTTVGIGALIEGSRLFPSGDSYTQLVLGMNNPGTSTFLDTSANNFAVTANGNAIGTTTAKYGSGAGFFDGTGDYLAIADSDQHTWGNDNTYELWVNPTTVSGSNEYVLAAHGASSNDHWRLSFFGTGSVNSLKLNLTWNHGGSNILTANITTGTITPNAWNHIAIVKASTSVKIYINGVNQLTGTASAGMNNFTGDMRVGAITFALGVNDYAGYIDEVRNSNGIARWSGDFTPPETGYANTFDIVSFTDIKADGSNDLSIVIGSTTTTTGRNFELASGQTSLADSWDTRCDPSLKEVLSVDPLLADQAYDKLKQAQIKRWKFKESDHAITGVMIDDPNIPEDIIWRLDDGKPGGFSGTGFLNFLYSAIKSLITKTEQQKTEIDNLKALLNPK